MAAANGQRSVDFCLYELMLLAFVASSQALLGRPDEGYMGLSRAFDTLRLLLSSLDLPKLIEVGVWYSGQTSLVFLSAWWSINGDCKHQPGDWRAA
jgi:hypothetical protein